MKKLRYRPYLKENNKQSNGLEVNTFGENMLYIIVYTVVEDLCV